MIWLRILFLALILASCSTQQIPLEKAVIVQTNAGDIAIPVEVRDTAEERAEGLMFREHLDPSAGMLFVFEREHPWSFWMRNTLIPLDMVFIDEKGTIVDILIADPCTADPCPQFTPQAPALYVLEVNQNFSREQGVEIGQQTKIMLPVQ